MSSYSPPFVSRFCFSSSIFCFIATILLLFSSIISLSCLLLMQRMMMMMTAIKETPPPAAAAMVVFSSERNCCSLLCYFWQTLQDSTVSTDLIYQKFIFTFFRTGMFIALPELRPGVPTLLPAEAGRGLHCPHPGGGAAPTQLAALS